MITYSTNWMGPINMDWFRDRGLTKTVREVLEEDQVFGKHKKGDVFEYEEVITYYSAGRIDIRDHRCEGYDGWNEYSVAPMHGEDWNALGEYLWDLKTEELLPYDTLIEQFEEHYGKQIRWADDIWYTCYECWMVTDLRETTKHKHKMSCTRRWDKNEIRN